MITMENQFKEATFLKKMVGIVALFSFGGTSFASTDVNECAVKSKGQCVSTCAQHMDRGVSDCATGSCEMMNCQ
jgi:hypothetical protein